MGTYLLHPREEQDTVIDAEASKKDPVTDGAEAIADNGDGDDDGEGDSKADPLPQKRSGSLILFDLDPERSEPFVPEPHPIR